MEPIVTKEDKVKISKKISTAVASETPLRELAGSFSKVAKNALNEANSLEIEKVEIFLKRLPKKLDGLKLVHLSDIHHSPFTGLEHIEKAIEIANELKPDIFLLTGDYVSHETEYVEPVAEVLGNLESKYGTFACLGNHDHWTDASAVTDSLRQNDITVLINEGVRFTADDVSFWLCGVDDYMVKQTDLNAALHGSFPDEMKMLLAHNPVIIRQAMKYDVDVMFSGHTHGGQVKIREKEKKILAHRRKLSSGLHDRNGTQIYITRGIGTVVLPVRYQCPPEISLITLKSEFLNRLYSRPLRFLGEFPYLRVLCLGDFAIKFLFEQVIVKNYYNPELANFFADGTYSRVCEPVGLWLQHLGVGCFFYRRFF